MGYIYLTDSEIDSAKSTIDMAQDLNWALQLMLGPSRMYDGRRVDANETAIFARQLEYIFTQTYDVEYPELQARSILPIISGIPSGAEQHTYSQFDSVGRAKFVENHDTDFPTVEAKGLQFTGKIKSIGAAYQYTLQELRAAAMANFQLDATKARMARLAVETLLDQVAAYGDAATGLLGLTNATNVPSTAKVGVAWNDPAITPAIILRDVRAMFSKIWLGTKTTHRANTLLLDSANYDLLANTDFAIVSGTTTLVGSGNLLSYIQANVPGLQRIIPWQRLDTAGASSLARIMALDLNPNVLGLVVPQEFEQSAPQNAGFSTKILCHMRTGGVVVRYPLAVTYMDGTRA